jgi:hypothetical protein
LKELRKERRKKKEEENFYYAAAQRRIDSFPQIQIEKSGHPH